MEKRSKIQINKPKTPPSVKPTPEPEQSFTGPTAEIDRIIADIEADIRAARAAADPDLGERLRGRLIQAQRIRSKALDDTRKHELRLVDSTEWRELSGKLSRMVGGCDRCRVAVLKLLDGDDGDDA